MNNETVQQARNEQQHSMKWMMENRSAAAALITCNPEHAQVLNGNGNWMPNGSHPFRPHFVYRLAPTFAPKIATPPKLTWEIAFGSNSGAPEWATCAVVEYNGIARWLGNANAKPALISGWIDCDRHAVICGMFDAADWRNSKIYKDQQPKQRNDGYVFNGWFMPSCEFIERLKEELNK